MKGTRLALIEALWMMMSLSMMFVAESDTDTDALTINDPIITPIVFPTYNIHYDANNGNAIGITEDQDGISGAEITIRECGFTFANHTFKEWNTAADGSGTSYNPGNTITLSGNMTLYAIWAYSDTTGWMTDTFDSIMSMFNSMDMTMVGAIVAGIIALLIVVKVVL